MHEPTDPDLIRVKSRVAAETWQKRVAKAKADEVVINAILKRVAEGASLNTAIARELPENRRSWAIRQVPAYRRRGIEALTDARIPREPKVSTRCREVVQAAREANPRLTTKQALRLLNEGGVSPLPSESTIKREFSKVDERRKYVRKKARREDRAGVEPLVEKVEAALRAPDVAGLAALTGFAYMPSTLAKFVSALAISGAGEPMLEAVGRQWHEVATARWQDPGAISTKARAMAEKNNARRAKLETRRDELAARRARLEPQRTIRKLDVAQDAIFTATKLTAMQLICFALREYVSSLAMTPETFIRRGLYDSRPQRVAHE